MSDILDAQEESSPSKKVTRRGFLKGLAVTTFATAIHQVVSRIPNLSAAPDNTNRSITRGDQIGEQTTKPLLSQKSPEKLEAIPTLKSPNEKANYPVFERLQTLNEDPFFNPPLYKNDMPETAAKDIKERLLPGSRDKVIASMNFLLRSTKNIEKIAEQLPLLDFVRMAGDLALAVKNDNHGRDASNLLVMNRLESYLGELVESWNNDSPIQSMHPDWYKGRIKQLSQYAQLYSATPEQASQKRTVAIQKLHQLVGSGKLINDDSVLTFLFALDDFTDPRGEVATSLIAEKVIDLVEGKSEVNLSASTLLQEANDDNSFVFFPLIATNSSHSYVWKNANWGKLKELLIPGVFSKAAEHILKRLGVWAKYVSLESKREVESRDYGGIKIYGENQACNEEDLRSIFLDSSGGLFSNGSMPSPDEIAEFRKSSLSLNERRIEFIVPKKIWARIKDLSIPPEEWFKLQIDALSEMLTRTKPELNMKTSISRIIIIEDDLIQKQKNIFAKPDDKEPIRLINPDDESFIYQADYLSPWSLDSHGRWVYLDNIFNHSVTHDVVGVVNGKVVPVDAGLIHEIAHQIVYMKDLYWGNTSDPDDQPNIKNVVKVASQNDSLEISKDLLKVALDEADAGFLLPTLSGERSNQHPVFINYTWPEQLQLLFMLKKYPDALITQYRPYVPSEKFVPFYEPMDNIPLSFQARSEDGKQFASLNLIPFSQKVDSPTAAILREDKNLHFNTREVYKSIFHPGIDATAVLLQFKTTTGECYYLPLPTYLVIAGYHFAKLGDKSEINLDIAFFQPANQEKDKDLERLSLALTPEEGYEFCKKRSGDNLYASMKLTFEGKNYYALWTKKYKKAT